LDGPDWKGMEGLNTQNGPSLAGGARQPAFARC
jgi:hypothetical protein